MRTIRGLGVENCAAITRVFKTPFLLRQCYMQCTEGERQINNLLNAGKMELMKNRSLFREQVVASRGDQTSSKNGGAGSKQEAELPKTIEDIDRVKLGNVVTAATPKLFNKLLKSFETETSLKMRKINKN